MEYQIIFLSFYFPVHPQDQRGYDDGKGKIEWIEKPLGTDFTDPFQFGEIHFREMSIGMKNRVHGGVFSGESYSQFKKFVSRTNNMTENEHSEHGKKVDTEKTVTILHKAFMLHLGDEVLPVQEGFFHDVRGILDMTEIQLFHGC